MAQPAQLAVLPVLDEPITGVSLNELWFGHCKRHGSVVLGSDVFMFEGARKRFESGDKRFWASDSRSFWLSANTESVTWIRGWHNSDSAEGRALLAASALAGTD